MLAWFFANRAKLCMGTAAHDEGGDGGCSHCFLLIVPNRAWGRLHIDEGGNGGCSTEQTFACAQSCWLLLAGSRTLCMMKEGQSSPVSGKVCMCTLRATCSNCSPSPLPTTVQLQAAREYRFEYEAALASHHMAVQEQNRRAMRLDADMADAGVWAGCCCFPLLVGCWAGDGMADEGRQGAPVPAAALSRGWLPSG